MKDKLVAIYRLLLSDYCIVITLKKFETGYNTNTIIKNMPHWTCKEVLKNAHQMSVEDNERQIAEKQIESQIKCILSHE
jgi:hypothetical protein